MPVSQMKLKDRKRSLPKYKCKKLISCKFCGYEHLPDKKKCPALGKTCKRCKGKNHLRRSVIKPEFTLLRVKMVI